MPKQTKIKTVPVGTRNTEMPPLNILNTWNTSLKEHEIQTNTKKMNKKVRPGQ